MKIQVPPQVQSAFDRFRQTGSLGPGAEKQGPEMDILLFTSLRANLEDVQALDQFDNLPGMDKNPAAGQLDLTSAAIDQLGKPYAELQAEALGADTVLIHKSLGKKQSFEMATNINGAPAYLSAISEGQEWTIGSNLLQMKDGAPVMSDGLPLCSGEFLSLPKEPSQ